MPTQKPALYHLAHSQSQKILWLIEELGFEYDLKLFTRGIKNYGPEGAPQDEIYQVSPLGKSPVFVTEDGRVLLESATIATYLIERYDTKNQFHGDGAPNNDSLRDETLTNIASASLSIVMVVELMFELVTLGSPWGTRWLTGAIHSKIKQMWTAKEFVQFFTYLESELGDQDWFMGAKPGRADFMLSWPFDMCTQRNFIDLKGFPKLERWYARVHARDAWKRGIEKGNGYDLNFKVE